MTVMPDESKDDQSVRVSGEEEPLRTRKLDPSALARLLDEWMQGDETEQRDMFEHLCRSLDVRVINSSREPDRFCWTLVRSE